MSKHQLSNVKVLSADAGWFPALIADVMTDLGSVQVLNVHLRPPLSDTGSATVSAYYESPNIHRKELADFLKAADLDAPLIIAGDFNENERRDAVKGLLDSGFCDALSLFDAKSKTWSWRVFPGLTLRNRYDHIVFSEHFRCTGAQVVDIRASDHRPVLAVFVINEELGEEPPGGPLRVVGEE
jgi:endonuclease/exonuclease/phosphatase family metal-dependent hydrolase